MTETACFLPDGHNRGGAGPVHQRKQDGADGGQRRPAVCRQNLAHGGKVADIGERPAYGVRHDGNRNDDFVCGEAEDKRRENDAVHAEQASERVKECGDVRKQAGIADGHIGKKPKQRTGGRSHGGGAPEHKQRAVEDRAHDDLSDLRAAIGRQLQRKGRGHAAQQRFGEQPGGEERHADAEQNDRGQQ